MSNLVKITHLTSAHPRYDTRIFIKMCSSLAKVKNFEINLIVSDNSPNEIKNNVHIISVKKLPGRLNRILKTTNDIFTQAIQLDSDIYHLHDPELIPIGIKLKKRGKKVIFDTHEDIALQILSKSYLNLYTRKMISVFFSIFEKYAYKKFDYIIAATPFIRDKFLKVTKNCIDINNYPKLEEFNFTFPSPSKQNAVCYIGSIAEIRGIKEIVLAMESVQNATLLLAGDFRENNVQNEVENYAGWKKVESLGFLGRNDVTDVMNKSKAGLVTLYPIPNYLDALPVKMFEYMASGLPVIASNFKLWQKIINEHKCGICVNPYSPSEIADAISYIITHPEEAETMGKNGQKAILEQYNWDIEEQKLFTLYQGLI